MPLYAEVSIKKYWEILKDDPKITIYFPKMAAGELPDFEFFWNVKNK